MLRTQLRLLLLTMPCAICRVFFGLCCMYVAHGKAIVFGSEGTNHLFHQPSFMQSDFSKRRIKTASNMKSQAFISPAFCFEPRIKPMHNASKSTLQFDMVVMPTEEPVKTHACSTVLRCCYLLPALKSARLAMKNLRFHCPVTLLPDQRCVFPQECSVRSLVYFY